MDWDSLDPREARKRIDQLGLEIDRWGNISRRDGGRLSFPPHYQEWLSDCQRCGCQVLPTLFCVVCGQPGSQLDMKMLMMPVGSAFARKSRTERHELALQRLQADRKVCSRILLGCFMHVNPYVTTQ